MTPVRGARYTIGAVAMLLAARVAAAEPVTLPGRTLERDGVSVTRCPGRRSASHCGRC